MDLRAPASPGQYLLRDDFDAGLATNTASAHAGHHWADAVRHRPTMDKMGLDPDGPVQVPDKVIEGAPGTPAPLKAGSMTRPRVCARTTPEVVSRESEPLV